MWESVANGEGLTQEQRMSAFYGYARGAMEVGLGFAIPGIAELFTEFALHNFDAHGTHAGDSWNQFISNPQVAKYIKEATEYVRIYGMA